MTQFGPEFTNVASRRGFPPEVEDTALALNELSALPLGWLYFGPRGYRIEDGATVIFEAHHTLWFARGAYLDLRENVTLIIRGGVRADPYTIFRLRDVYELSVNIPGRTRWPDPADVDPSNTVIRFEGTRVRRIFPEWFGVQPGLQSVDSSLGPASTRAFQACVNAACRDRVRTDARGHTAESLPPLPIETRSIVAMNSTIEALPDANGRGALWLAGRGDASTRNLGVPSLVRLPASARINVGASRVERDLVEKTRSALLRVHPRVSVQISGVGMRCEGASRRGDQPSDYDVENVILVEEAASSSETKLDPALSRHVYLDRCGISGGRRAALSIRPYLAALPGPRLSNTWRRRSVNQRSTRVGVRDCTFDGVLIPGDGGDRPDVSSRMIIEVDGLRHPPHFSP